MNQYMVHFTGNSNAADIGTFQSQEDAEEYVTTNMADFYDPENDESFEVFIKST